MPLFHYSNALPVLYQITREQYQCMFLKSLNSFTTLNSEESTLFKNVNGTEQFCENKLLDLKKIMLLGSWSNAILYPKKLNL